MVEIHVKKIVPPPEMTADQLEDLAHKTEGFSGSDIAIMVRDAIMEPVRRCQVSITRMPCLPPPGTQLNFSSKTNCQSATHFKWIDVPATKEGGEPQKKLQPCSMSTPGCMEMSLMELASKHGPETLIAPPVLYMDFEKTLSRQVPHPPVPLPRNRSQSHSSSALCFAIFATQDCLLLPLSIFFRMPLWFLSTSRNEFALTSLFSILQLQGERWPERPG